MKRCLLILGLLLAAGCTSSVPLETGVSRTLARSRAGQISDIRYHLAFTVPDSTDQPCRGTVTIHFTQQPRGCRAGASVARRPSRLSPPLLLNKILQAADPLLRRWDQD